MEKLFYSPELITSTPSPVPAPFARLALPSRPPFSSHTHTHGPAGSAEGAKRVLRPTPVGLLTVNMGCQCSFLQTG
uniref:Uncharacterized protein n=1 Tax=Knipowitschia caucasica TaxID=637954 RepID=A0AAV2LFU2_KNICA